MANDVEASIDPCNVPLSTGVTLKADVFVKCFPTWNTGWVPDGFVDPSGRIKVNEFHQSLADDRVFAIGCCTHTQYSVVPMLDVEIASAAKNLAALLRGETPLPSVFKQTAPVKNPAAIQLPFGDWAMINVASFDSGLMKCMAYCCGCLNPLWPCCGCCGWPCMYPEGEMAGKCIKMVAPHGKVRVKENGHHNRIRFTSFGPAISPPADFHRSGAFSRSLRWVLLHTLSHSRTLPPSLHAGVRRRVRLQGRPGGGHRGPAAAGRILRWRVCPGGGYRDAAYRWQAHTYCLALLEARHCVDTQLHEVPCRSVTLAFIC